MRDRRPDELGQARVRLLEKKRSSAVMLAARVGIGITELPTGVRL